jgi:putative two-component system response regulator
LKTIFVVDDNSVNLLKAQEALAGHYRVLTIPSAEKMFLVLEKVTPDLMLLDIKMPGMDGFTALENLMKNEGTAKIPVIFLTASTDEALKVQGMESGAVDFITKPFSESDLLNRIASIIQRPC